MGFTLASFSVFGDDPFSKLKFVILWKTPVSLSILRCSLMSPIGKGSLSQCDFFALLRISFVSESVTSLNLSNLQYGVSGK